ncbi:MAG: hypothetical protein ABJA62_08415, partial [Luteimonas sp.]
VDKYLSGHCQWRMIAVEATVGDKALQTMGMGTVIEGRHFDEDDNAPRCSSDAPRCTEERARRLGNSDESIPVQMRCDTARRAWQDVPGGRTWDNLCDDPFDDSYKTKHLLKPHTRQVELNFIAQALKQSRDETIPNNDAISSAKEPAP